MTPIPHNHDSLTPEQVETHLGFRLLDEDEVTKISTSSNRAIWAFKYGIWDCGNWDGSDPSLTYRTKLSREELRKARGLPPEEIQPCDHQLVAVLDELGGICQTCKCAMDYVPSSDTWVPNVGKPPVATQKYSHYFREWRGGKLDFYRIADLFGPWHACQEHAAKKIMFAGERGSKDLKKDIQEAIDTLTRWQVIIAENEQP